MHYLNTVKAKFIERPNRFIAYVDIEGKREKVHVKNTGRCKELLLSGADVVLEHSESPGRKTAYDLIAVYKRNTGLINIDSQAPNKVVKEWLESGKYGFSMIKPEYGYGSSRIDFYMEKNDNRYLMEVKGCTLEVNGTGYFPDAPTERGVKHLYELIKAKEEGYMACAAFVIQMEGITKVFPNISTHPEFGEALYKAEAAGVRIIYLPCIVREDSLSIDDKLAREINGELFIY